MIPITTCFIGRFYRILTMRLTHTNQEIESISALSCLLKSVKAEERVSVWLAIRNSMKLAQANATSYIGSK